MTSAHHSTNIGLVVFTILFGLGPLLFVLWGQWKRHQLGQTLLGQDEDHVLTVKRLVRETLPLIVFYGVWCFGTVEALRYILAGHIK